MIGHSSDETSNRSSKLVPNQLASFFYNIDLLLGVFCSHWWFLLPLVVWNQFGTGLEQFVEIFDDLKFRRTCAVPKFRIANITVRDNQRGGYSQERAIIQALHIHERLVQSSFFLLLTASKAHHRNLTFSLSNSGPQTTRLLRSPN